jgi:hypothetical protein
MWNAFAGEYAYSDLMKPIFILVYAYLLFFVSKWAEHPSMLQIVLNTSTSLITKP